MATRIREGKEDPKIDSVIFHIFVEIVTKFRITRGVADLIMHADYDFKKLRG